MKSIRTHNSVNNFISIIPNTLFQLKETANTCFGEPPTMCLFTEVIYSQCGCFYDLELTSQCNSICEPCKYWKGEIIKLPQRAESTYCHTCYEQMVARITENHRRKEFDVVFEAFELGWDVSNVNGSRADIRNQLRDDLQSLEDDCGMSLQEEPPVTSFPITFTRHDGSFHIWGKLPSKG